MNAKRAGRIVLLLQLCVAATPALAINRSVPAIHGDISRSLLGDGTGVVIGVIDSGVDWAHPALAGSDSLGNPRLVAEGNFVPHEPGNTGADIFGHGTQVASPALSSDATYTGLAPDARFISARVLDSAGRSENDIPLRNGIGFAIDQGADILNMSFNFGSAFADGRSQVELLIDWAAYERGITSVVSSGNTHDTVRSPASAYNGIGVGATGSDYASVANFSSGAFTSDGRMKPELVAPGQSIIVANSNWEAGNVWRPFFFGTSIAAPHVTGMIAQLLEAGATHGLNSDPLVVKATLLNSANKSVLDSELQTWEQSDLQLVDDVLTTRRSLDTHAGAGQIDGLALAQQYLTGEMEAGLVKSVGWDFNTIDHGQVVDYILGAGLAPGSSLTATLTWYHHVGRNDDGNGIIDVGDVFNELVPLNDLDLQILRNGRPIAKSVSELNNVEHLQIPIDQPGQYMLRVLGFNVVGGAERFSLAWHGTAVPEPASVLIIAIAAAGLIHSTRERLK